MNGTLEDIIRQRRSTRSFDTRPPEREMIKKIAESAVYAPYGGATGIPLEELRRIFIFERGTAGHETFKSILMEQVAAGSRKLNMAVKFLPFLKAKFGAFAEKLRKISENGIPALEQAPYIIVIAERKGFPPVEKQSLAHTMQNMWLTATDNGLGFQMISAVGTLSGNKRMAELTGLPPGRFAFDGCAVGYMKTVPGRREPKAVDDFIKWM